MGPRSPDRLRTCYTPRLMGVTARIAGLCLCLLLPLPGQPEQPPSFLVVTVDALRADRGPGGVKSEVAPGLARWGRRGVRFPNAHAATVITYPSLRSFLTGRYPDTFLIGPPVPPARSLPTILRPHGYRTCFLSGFQVFAPEDPSLEGPLGSAFDEVRQDLGLEAMAAAARKFIAESRGPWLVWLHVIEPHLPYTPPPGFARGETPAELYDGEVRHVDSVIAPLMESVAERAWTILSADHGEELPSEDAHGHAGHGQTLFDPALRIPLVIRGPDVEPRDVPALTSPVDLLPTFLELAGLPAAPLVEGRSLVAAIDGPAEAELPARSGIFVETRIGNDLVLVTNPLTAFLSDSGKIVRHESSAKLEAFDLDRDPGEVENLFQRSPERGEELLAEWKSAFRSRMSLWTRDPQELNTLQLLGAARAEHRELLTRAQHGTPGVRRIAVRGLAHRPCADLKAGFVALANSEDPIVREWAAVAWSRVCEPAEDWPVEMALASGDPEVRSAALQSLTLRPLPRAAQLLAASISESPRADWRQLVVLNACGHRRGIELTHRLFAEQPLYVRAVEKVLADLVRCPRPEIPGLIEAHISRLSKIPVLKAILVNIAERFPSQAMERVLAELERSATAEELPHIEDAKSRLHRAIDRARRELRALEERPSWGSAPFAAAWELAGGINFVAPAPGALRGEEWNAPRPFLPVRTPRAAEVTLRPAPPRGRAQRAALQVIAAADAMLIVHWRDGRTLRLALRPGEGTYVFPLPESPVPEDLKLRIEGISPELVGFRELIFLP